MERVTPGDPARVAAGFIGLGSQGAPIAARMLRGGHPLTVWARRAEATAGLVAEGARAAVSPAELAATCDHVGLCVLDDAGVRAVCDELVPAMRPGSLLAIHSTVLPQTCEALAAACAARGILLLDAPVSGGGPAAAAGTLTVMCGGTDAAFARALPVLETFGGTIVLLGPAGAGQRAKIVNNALMAAHMGLAHQALGMAERLGIDRAALGRLVAASSGRSFGFEVAARLPAPQAFSHGAKLLKKDIDLLAAILPPQEGPNALAAAALPFLEAAGVTEDQA